MSTEIATNWRGLMRMVVGLVLLMAAAGWLVSAVPSTGFVGQQPAFEGGVAQTRR